MPPKQTGPFTPWLNIAKINIKLKKGSRRKTIKSKAIKRL